MQNQDHYGSGLSSNSQRVLVQPSNHLNQSMSSYSFVRYQPNNSVQLMANASSHHPSQTTSYTFSPQVQSWAASGEQAQLNSHVQQLQHHQPQQHISQQQIHQRLKVEDALSYLDQVKLKFGHQPQVYNEFLDIMKEFKSQAIDTPGVIRKVSMLFQGHTELIVGFNTFLPQGYSIEVKENQTINVRQPGQQVVPLTNFNSSNPVQTHLPNLHQANQPHAVRQNATATEVPQNVNQFNTNQGQPVQFNHAINYVNKIKSCYQGRPEIYKAFLDILHSYQKEQKNLKEGVRQTGNKAPITEAEVYAQVSQLFNDQPELLMEFRQFLPDANGGNEFMKGLGVHENVCQGNQDFQYSHRVVSNPTSSSSKALPQNKGGVSINSPIRNKSSSVTCSVPPTKRQKLSFPKSSPRELADGFDLACHDHELTKFVRRLVSQHPSRESQCRELLKQVDLLSRKLVDTAEFCRLANPTIEKMPELKPFIKNLLGKNDVTSGMDRRAAFPEKLKEPERHEKECFPDLSTCPQHGKHYRILPSDYVGERSSNRSELCKKVLNETHAIYASILSESESEGDNTLRRNIYEDHVFQCEDERYEMDMVIDLNTSVLRGLKKLMPKIQKMNSEDLAKFQVEDLSTVIGVSEVHIETALKRLYGEKFLTMMEGLKKCPCTAVPIIMKSMQIKDKEWKGTKKSFERVWSDQMDKFYLKSLDFQGLKFKQTDIKNIRSKSLIKEIENLFNERDDDDSRMGDDNSTNGEKSKREEARNCTAKGLRLNCQNRPSYDDAVMLILSSVNRQSAIQVEDQDRIRNVLLNFLPSVLFLSNHKSVKAEVKQEQSQGGSDEEDYNDEDDDGSRKAGISTRPKIRVKKEVLSDSETSHNGPDHSHGTLNSASFYCNDNWYILVRLLVLLCERLCLFKEKAHKLFDEELINKGVRSEMMTCALQARCPESLNPNSYYATFLTMVKSLTNGMIESSSFEDQLREMFGINSYVAFTVDKLILNIVKQLQHVTSKEECLVLADYYESVSRSDCTWEQYEQNAKELMADKLCFKLNIEKNSEAIELCYVLIHPTTSDSQPCEASVKHNDTTILASEMDLTSSADGTAAGHFSVEVAQVCQGAKERKGRRKSSEVRDNNLRGLGLDESSYSFRSMPDFFRKFRQKISLKQKYNALQLESTPQNCLVQALESIASSHPAVNASPHLRSDYDNDTADHCLNEESSDGSQKMLHDKDGDKSEDESSCSGSYRRFAIQTGCTEIHVCRPGCLEKARKNNHMIHLAKKRRFNKWKNNWDSANLEYVENFIGSPCNLSIPTCRDKRTIDSNSPKLSSSPQSIYQRDVLMSPNSTLPEQSSHPNIQRDESACPASPACRQDSPTFSPASPSFHPGDPPPHQLHNSYHQSVRNENDLSLS